jgi:GDPmannose 4,6-dehydratase
MKAIIFGANGQDGYYLDALLKKQNIESIGVSRSGDWINGDIANWNFVEQIIKQEKPNYIFHLAANSTTRHDVVFENHETISTGTINLLEAVKRHAPEAKVFISGSGLQFQNNGVPIKESDPFEATSPYAFARIQSVYAARYYRKLGIKTYVGYFFNHESPRRTERHLSKMIAEACKRIKNGSTEKISLGDISVKKEWTYASDVVNGIWALVQQDKIFESNIASGKAYSIKDWLEICFGHVGLNWQDHFEQKNNFTPEYSVLVSDPTTLKGMGWKDELDISSLANMMLEI